MTKDSENKKCSEKVEQWYSLEDQDILCAADEMEIKLSKAEIKKARELAPDYIDWFSAIENAILFIKADKCK